MNRSQRRNEKSPKSNVRKAGLTYLTVAGVVGGTIGLASPAQAATYTPGNCNQLANDLTELTTNGGTLTANFSGSCDLAEGYVFQLATTIVGPAVGSLNLRFTGSYAGFSGNTDFSVSNLNFTKGDRSNLSFFIETYPNRSVTVSNSKFSNADLSAAIYAEGNVTVSDSTFEELTTNGYGAAISVTYTSTTTVSNSTFIKNKAVGPGFGGAIFSDGTLSVANSTFDSNEAGNRGGAIFASHPEISNSTFVGNSAMTGAAVLLSEGGLISNSTFWNNGDADTYSIELDSNGDFGFFGNILANDNANTVKLIDPAQTTTDLGANLYTDTSFDDTTTGDGSSKLVTSIELKLKTLFLNQTAPTNSGSTKTVAISSGSIAENYYSVNSSGAQEGVTRNNLAASDQRGAARPFGAGYDVGAFELGQVQTPPEVATKATIAKQRIAFAPGSSKLSTASKLKLHELAVEIQAKGLKTINLEGFTATYTKASVSGKALRVSLSKSRAVAVEKYLKSVFKKNGYAVTFTKTPKGAANPVKSNKTEKGRKYNRRVEIVIN